MTADGAPRISTGIAAAVLLLVAVYYGSDVLAPLALALFIIAIVWPLQQRLQSRLPALVALAITILITTVVCLAFASLAALAFSRLGRSLIADASRYQTLFLPLCDSRRGRSLRNSIVDVTREAALASAGGWLTATIKGGPDRMSWRRQEALFLRQFC